LSEIPLIASQGLFKVPTIAGIYREKNWPSQGKIETTQKIRTKIGSLVARPKNKYATDVGSNDNKGEYSTHNR
jgi:hypothetical protein